MKKYLAYAKVNIFLKIIGKRENYHDLFSRFVRVDSLFDTLYFRVSDKNSFHIVGDFSCTQEQNTIYKAYVALLKATKSKHLEEFMNSYEVVVEKHIPAFAGLGGGSSDAATFLHMCNDEIKLNLTIKELSNIGFSVGADVPFFIYNYKSANVSGVGEIIEEFIEKPIELELYTPNIEISTPEVFKIFREFYYKELDVKEKKSLSKISSLDVFKNYSISDANDLYEPALKLHPDLSNCAKDGWFFSGSGSTFFKLKDN